ALRARVDAEAQEDADGHVADEAVLHRGAERVPGRVRPRRLARWPRLPDAGEGDIPVAAEPDLARGEVEEVPGRQLLNAGQDGVRIGDVPIAEIASDAAEGEVTADLGVREQRTQRGA